MSSQESDTTQIRVSSQQSKCAQAYRVRVFECGPARVKYFRICQFHQKLPVFPRPWSICWSVTDIPRCTACSSRSDPNVNIRIRHNEAPHPQMLMCSTSILWCITTKQFASKSFTSSSDRLNQKDERAMSGNLRKWSVSCHLPTLYSFLFLFLGFKGLNATHGNTMKQSGICKRISWLHLR
jgi:hypothetical protein